MQSREHCWNDANVCLDDDKSQQQQTMTTSAVTVTPRPRREGIGGGGSKVEQTGISSSARIVATRLFNGCLSWRADVVGGTGTTTSPSCSPPVSPSSSPGAAAVAAGTAACSSYQSYSCDDLYQEDQEANVTCSVDDPSCSRQLTAAEKDRRPRHSHPPPSPSSNKVTPRTILCIHWNLSASL